MSLFRWQQEEEKLNIVLGHSIVKINQKKTEPIVASNPTISISKAELSGCDGHKSSPLTL